MARTQPANSAPMRRLAGLCYDRRGTVVTAWIIILVGFLALGAAVGGSFKTQFALPGSESQAAIDILNAHGFNSRTGNQGQIVFQSNSTVDDPAVKASMEDLFGKIQQSVKDASVVSPYDDAGARQVSQDRTIAYAEVNFS